MSLISEVVSTVATFQEAGTDTPDILGTIPLSTDVVS